MEGKEDVLPFLSFLFLPLEPSPDGILAHSHTRDCENCHAFPRTRAPPILCLAKKREPPRTCICHGPFFPSCSIFHPHPFMTMALNLQTREHLSALIVAITKTGDLYLDPIQVKVIIKKKINGYARLQKKTSNESNVVEHLFLSLLSP